MKQKNLSVKKMTTIAMLIAVGIVIPMISPFKIIMEPASFTLGSHVAIFMAMFISPMAAVAVSIGTTFGFFIGGFPIVIVLRAATHVIFAFLGSFYLSKKKLDLHTAKNRWIFSFIIGIIHAFCETIVVTLFYFSQGLGESYYVGGYIYSVILLVGIGSLIHSFIDFEISYLITKTISRKSSIKELFENFKMAKTSH